MKTLASSLDSYVDPLGRALDEEPIVSFYSTAGRFEDDRATGLVATSELTMSALLEGDRGAQIYVVVRDGRGGQAFRGPIEIVIIR